MFFKTLASVSEGFLAVLIVGLTAVLKMAHLKEWKAYDFFFSYATLRTIHTVVRRQIAVFGTIDFVFFVIHVFDFMQWKFDEFFFAFTMLWTIHGALSKSDTIDFVFFVIYVPYTMCLNDSVRGYMSPFLPMMVQKVQWPTRATNDI